MQHLPSDIFFRTLTTSDTSRESSSACLPTQGWIAWTCKSVQKLVKVKISRHLIEEHLHLHLLTSKVWSSSLSVSILCHFKFNNMFKACMNFVISVLNIEFSLLFFFVNSPIVTHRDVSPLSASFTASTQIAIVQSHFFFLSLLSLHF